MTGVAVCPIFVMRARCREEPGGGRGGDDAVGRGGLLRSPPPLVVVLFRGEPGGRARL